MTEEECLKMENYFNLIRNVAINSKNSSFDLKIMDYISTVLSQTGDEELENLSKYAIADMYLAMTNEDGIREYDNIILANDGSNLAILQNIGNIEDFGKDKDKMQIGIILDKSARLEHLDINQINNGLRLEEEDRYSEILKVASDIKNKKISKKKGAISRIVYLISNSINRKGNTPNNLNKKKLQEILQKFRNFAGEKTYKIYKERKENSRRKRTIQWTETPNNNKLTREEKRISDEAAKESRKKIEITTNNDTTMTPHNDGAR